MNDIIDFVTWHTHSGNFNRVRVEQEFHAQHQLSFLTVEGLHSCSLIIDVLMISVLNKGDVRLWLQVISRAAVSL